MGRELFIWKGNKTVEEMNWYVRMFIATTLLLALCVTLASADEYKGIAKYKLVQCGINEAHPSEVEILNMYHAIFNRVDRYDNLVGIFGCGKHFQPTYHYITGQRLLEQAIHEREVHGINRVNSADHWEGKAFKEPYWADDMALVFEDGHTRYYKEVK